MKPAPVLLSILILLSFMACDELLSILNGGGGNNPIVSYPLRLGNRWSYTSTFHSYNFRPLAPGAVDPNINEVTFYDVEIVGERRLPRQPGIPGDTIMTVELRQIGRSANQTYPPSFLYLTQDTSGLCVHGYNGGTLAAPKIIGSVRHEFLFAARTFRSPDELHAFLAELQGDIPDTLMREYPPLKSIHYPLQDGVQWTFRPAGRPWRIDKRIGPMLRRTVLGRQVRYHEVRWLYDIDNNGQWDGDIWIIDQISNKGMVKRTIDVKDVLISSPNDPDPIGKVDFREEYITTLLGVP